MALSLSAADDIAFAEDAMLLGRRGEVDAVDVPPTEDEVLVVGEARHAEMRQRKPILLVGSGLDGLDPRYRRRRHGAA